MSILDIIGCSRAHHEILERIRKVAAFDAEVLITGPTGVGKEVYARLIHASSPRARGPFVAVNCGALPGELFENELFGHSAGAFTGARAESDGLAAAAENGTLFLDEIDALQLQGQIKLLRFVQFREYRRLGETRLRSSNVRILAATNCDLQAAVEAKAFREDLLYRLRVIPLEIPPLRQRPDDVVEFFNAFSESYARSYQAPRITLSRAGRRAVQEYAWPGNVREVENCVRYLTCLQLQRDVEPEDLPFQAPLPKETWMTPDLLALPLKQAKRELIVRFEREYLERALIESGGNVSQAARASRKNRRAFFELMRRHGLQKVSQLERLRGAETVNGAGRKAKAPDEWQPASGVPKRLPETAPDLPQPRVRHAAS